MGSKMGKKFCSWCGTNMRGRNTCPRGPVCAQQETEHDRMLKLIEEQKNKARR